PLVAVPSVSHALIEATNPVVPPVGIGVEDALRHIDQEIVVAKPGDTFNIASIEMLVDPAHDLSVLLRHRPRSISLWPLASSCCSGTAQTSVQAAFFTG